MVVEFDHLFYLHGYNVERATLKKMGRKCALLNGEEAESIGCSLGDWEE